jgi:hypothetical protein
LKGDSQAFTGIRLPLKTASGVHPFKLEIIFTSYGNNWLYANVGIQSYWSGRASLQGQDVELGVVEGPWDGAASSSGSFLVLRPWDRRAAPFDLTAGTADALDFPDQLFWHDTAYRLARRYQTDGRTERCLLEMTEQKPALGELRTSGAYLNRILLENRSGYTAVLDGPSGIARIPLGTYRVTEVWVKKDTSEAFQSSTREVTVTDKSPALLVGGGPLTNSVSVRRRGKNLVLDYQLVGANGGAYKLQSDDQQNPPGVTILHQGKSVASGKFAYG